jgi:hypothetical protein
MRKPNLQNIPPNVAVEDRIRFSRSVVDVSFEGIERREVAKMSSNKGSRFWHTTSRVRTVLCPGDLCSLCGKGEMRSIKGKFAFKCTVCNVVISKTCPCSYQKDQCSGCQYSRYCSSGVSSLDKVKE